MVTVTASQKTETVVITRAVINISLVDKEDGCVSDQSPTAVHRVASNKYHEKRGWLCISEKMWG